MVKELIEETEKLIEDYKRKIQHCHTMLKKAELYEHDKSQIRVTAKKGCFTATIVELERLIRPFKRQLAEERIEEIVKEQSDIKMEKFVTPQVGIFGEDLQSPLDIRYESLEKEKQSLQDFLTYQ